MMNRVSRHSLDSQVGITFLGACTSTPVSEQAQWSVRQVVTLLEYALASGDLSSLRNALLADGALGVAAADVYAGAVQDLADTLDDSSVSQLESFVHRCAEIERALFSDVTSPIARITSYAFAM